MYIKVILPQEFIEMILKYILMEKTLIYMAHKGNLEQQYYH